MNETEAIAADQSNDAPGNEHEHKTFVIFIDRQQFKVQRDVLTGAELRDLTSPPVGQDRDLWEEVPGPNDDKKINDTDVVTLREGLHFFTTPRAVTPGAPDASRS